MKSNTSSIGIELIEDVVIAITKEVEWINEIGNEYVKNESDLWLSCSSVLRTVVFLIE